MPFNNETRVDFINLSDDFINWLVGNLCGNDGILHSWVSSGRPQIGTPIGQVWSCESLYHAYQQYYWGATNPLSGQTITSYEESHQLLTRLSNTLTQQLTPGNHQGILTTCTNVLIWGGVNTRQKIATVIRDELQSDNLIADYLNQCIALLNNINHLNNQQINIQINNNNYKLQLDSGTTKIFSLICDNFIIYDGRVGAALAMLVKKWSFETNQEIPNVLRFAWSGNGANDNRNPNIDDNCHRTRGFPRINNNRRIAHNIAANWLCLEILERAKVLGQNNCFNQLEETQRLRALEAALFMIGYRVNRCGL